jgi:hypothetical protein
MKVSLRKIRQVPFTARKELVKCLPIHDFEVEVAQLFKEFPNEDYNDFLDEKSDYSKIYFILDLGCKNLDLIRMVELLTKNTSYVNIDYLTKCIIKHKDNPTFKEAIAILEEWLVRPSLDEVCADNIYPFMTLNTWLNGSYCQNRRAIIDAMFRIANSKTHSRPIGTGYVLEYITRYKNSLSQGDYLKKYIEDTLAIFDIIV